MTLRERLADWIGGGALTEERLFRKSAEDQWALRQDADEKKASALRAIIACKTLRANATVRRMVRIAREALK
jgi:hypothetical protein